MKSLWCKRQKVDMQYTYLILLSILSGLYYVMLDADIYIQANLAIRGLSIRGFAYPRSGFCS